MTDERVTVFIPVRHFHEDYLRQAVASVFAQSRNDWNLLLVVHPEQEASVNDLLRHALADARVRLVAQEGKNLAGAYNTAMRRAETSFVAVLLGDDTFAPNAVEVVGESIRLHPEVDFFHCGRYVVDGDGRRLSSDHLPVKPVTAQSFRGGSPVKHLMCWRAQRGLACGGVDESLENFGSDDWDFPWTMLDHGAVFMAVHEALYVYRDHRDGFRLTTHVPRNAQRKTMRRILSKHGVPEREVRAIIRRARRSYLQQGLFQSALHRWFMERFGFDARRGWRETYR